MTFCKLLLYFFLLLGDIAYASSVLGDGSNDASGAPDMRTSAFLRGSNHLEKEENDKQEMIDENEKVCHEK
jgi:hypothetical protein